MLVILFLVYNSEARTSATSDKATGGIRVWSPHTGYLMHVGLILQYCVIHCNFIKSVSRKQNVASQKSSVRYIDEIFPVCNAFTKLLTELAPQTASERVIEHVSIASVFLRKS